MRISHIMLEENGSNIKEVMILFEKGFTLIEVIITILLIGVITAAIFPMFFHGFSTLFSSASKTDAINNARIDLIRELRNTATTPSAITINFKHSSGLNTTISAYHYSPPPKKYKLPNKGEKTLELDYYTYAD